MKGSKKKLIMIKCIVFFNVVLFHYSFCGQSNSVFPTNIELLSSLIDQVASTAVERLEWNAGDTICVARSVEESKVERFVHDRFYRIFSEAGLRLFFSCDSAENGFALFLQAWNAGVNYQEYVGRSLFRQGRVLRKAELSVSLKMVRSRTGQLVWVGDLADHMEDEIPVAYLARAEEGSAMLGQPALPTEEKLRRWFEPMVVLGVMGVVTCLFYLIRSS
jgi:hypothetical protein